jgi:hypothetical protein
MAWSRLFAEEPGSLPLHCIDPVLFHSGCYNKIPYMGRLRNPEKSNVKVLADSVSDRVQFPVGGTFLPS